jgi:hypothetical protein
MFVQSQNNGNQYLIIKDIQEMREVRKGNLRTRIKTLSFFCRGADILTIIEKRNKK